MDSHSPHCEW